MEKRVLIAVLLSFLVLWAYTAIVPHPKPPLKASAAAAAAGEAAGSSGQAPGSEPPAAAQPPGPAPAAATVADATERSIVVETKLVRAVFSNRGGVLTSWTLKKYDDGQGHHVDLVPTGLPPSEPRPFSVRLADPVQTGLANSALFHVSTPDLVDATSAPATLVFDYEDQAGFHAHKQFRVDPDSYVVTFTIAVRDKGADLNPVVQWGPGLGDSQFLVGKTQRFGTYVQHSQAITYAEGSCWPWESRCAQRLPAPKTLQHPTWQGDYPFAGIDDHYFLASLVQPGQARITFRPSKVALPGQTDLRELMSFDALFATPPTDKRVFVGPKDFDVLAAADRDLVRTIYYGTFAFLAVPLLHALKWINAFVGNYGWSIIILTFIINALMFPLRHKSVASMRKMQAIQPQVKAIQDRYANLKMTDPAQQNKNTELMALYREKGVNPTGGCAPMLLTLPILFAFYSMLSVSIELRGQPFALWIHDLSQHDPYYITPVLMGLSMLWQQRLTPTPDPAQARVMMLTPIMFLVFFLWAPSGLVLYWLVSNLLGIAQQYATGRIIGMPVQKGPGAAAERRLKQAGTGQTDRARGGQR